MPLDEPETFSEYDQIKDACQDKISEVIISATECINADLRDGCVVYKKGKHTPEMLIEANALNVSKKCKLFKEMFNFLKLRFCVTQNESSISLVVGELVVERLMEAPLPDGNIHKWTERRLISRSYAHEKRKIRAFEKRLAKAEKRLKKLKLKKDESVADFRKRAELILKGQRVADFIVPDINESIKRKRKYIGRGRSGPDRPYKMEKIRTVALSFKHDDNAINQFKALAGWRIFISDTPAD